MQNEMTAAEAARRIEEHNRVHYAKEGEQAHYITQALEYAASIMRKYAAGELVDVVHGRWVQDDDGFDDFAYACSVCGAEIESKYSIQEMELYYCQSCGAIMDEKDGEQG
jgi:DNA-directed RNA polymerase subunit RPC12/RpoP